VKKRRSPKIRKGVTTENCETRKKVNIKRREKEGKIYSAVKKYEYQKVSFVHFVCAVIDVHYKKTLPLP
jgi:hypothetical protein